MEILLEHVGKGFMNMLMIAMPCVLTAAGIGLVVGVLQAVTQVQEQTIAAAPKIFGVFLVIILFGGFFNNRLTSYFRESANLAFNVVTKQGNFVLPADGSLDDNYTFDNNEHYMQMKQPNVEYIMKNPDKRPYTEPKSKFSNYPSTPNSVKTNFAESKNILEGKR